MNDEANQSIRYVNENENYRPAYTKCQISSKLVKVCGIVDSITGKQTNAQTSCIITSLIIYIGKYWHSTTLIQHYDYVIRQPVSKIAANGRRH